MSSVWAPVVAAIGAAFLTVAGTLGVTWYRDKLRGAAEARDRLREAVTTMLARSMGAMMRAQALGLQMRLRSGLGEGLDVTMRLRQPADAQELHDWMAIDLSPMYDAWSVIWAHGDQETIRLSNTLFSTCADLWGTTTTHQPAETMVARFWRVVAGEQLTPEMEASRQRDVKAVAHAREALAQHARRTLGLPAVTMFGHDAPESPAQIQPGGTE